MKRREFALSVAFLSGCLYPDPRSNQIEDHNGLTITYMGYETEDSLKYYTPDAEESEILPGNEQYVKVKFSVANDSDEPIDWYDESDIKIDIDGELYEKIDPIREIQEGNGTAGPWRYQQTFRGPHTETVDPEMWVTHNMIFDVPEGEPLLVFSFRGDTARIRS